ncbi:MAG: 1-deoxy-D-xylulose-5-phosphate synthase, partial [Proteobacteria bacterium]|nr:1-deoxy-D-xylulose-5-phosphate synthase [Pseudomonadota bacterium]
MNPPDDRFPLLSRIDSPADLRDLPRSQLQELNDELRRYLITTGSQIGGHLAAGLGTLELTGAL